MPFAIDESKFRDQVSYDVSQRDTPPGAQGKGIPVMQIPHLEYPRVIYMHPVEPFKTIVHRNNRHEVVHEEIVPAEHLTKIVQDAKELAQALKDGWVKEPYIAPPLPDPNAHLYQKK